MAVGAGVTVGKSVGSGDGVGTWARASPTRWSMRRSISAEEGPQAANARLATPAIAIPAMPVARIDAALMKFIGLANLQNKSLMFLDWMDVGGLFSATGGLNRFNSSKGHHSANTNISYYSVLWYG